LSCHCDQEEEEEKKKKKKKKFFSTTYSLVYNNAKNVLRIQTHAIFQLMNEYVNMNVCA
jgi:L-cystine uptake protein TcyP (sodium:dicarboxylate symporter family)